MEAKRQYQHRDTDYISGNTVRKLQPSREYDPDYEYGHRTREKHIKKAVLRKQERIQIDLVSLIFLTVAILITSYVCVEYLKVQTSIISKNRTIASMENEVMDMKTKNNETLDRINASVDLAYVYKTATKKLKMVHAKDNQIITYKSIKSDFVRQYDNIPSGDKSDFLDYILKNK
jgi:hypothetical protein